MNFYSCKSSCLVKEFAKFYNIMFMHDMIIPLPRELSLYHKVAHNARNNNFRENKEACDSQQENITSPGLFFESHCERLAFITVCHQIIRKSTVCVTLLYDVLICAVFIRFNLAEVL